MKDSFTLYVIDELLRDIPGVTAKSMFGGVAIYKDRQIFGMIVDGQLYFKVDEESKKEYEGYGSKPFTYTAKNGKQVAMSYWELPAAVMDDQSLLIQWVERALHAGKKR